MESFQVKGKETRELNQIYKKLEQDWHAYKESKPTTTASRKMFKPQRDSSSSPPAETWKNIVMPTRVKDVAAQEILQERREAIESGKFKGRRLFQSTMEGEISDNNNDNMGDPQGEVRSMSFQYSEDEHDENEYSRGYSSSCSSLSSSSSSCLVGDFVDKDMVAAVADIREVASISRPASGTRYGVLLGGFVVALLMLVALCIGLARSSGGHDYDVFLVPT